MLFLSVSTILVMLLFALGMRVEADGWWEKTQAHIKLVLELEKT